MEAMDLTPQAWEIEIIRSKRLSHKGCESLGIGLPEFVLYGKAASAVCIISDSVILRPCHPRKHYPLFLLLSDNHY